MSIKYDNKHGYNLNSYNVSLEKKCVILPNILNVKNKFSKDTISFKAGLTKAIAAQIQHTDIKFLTAKLAKRGIECEFKGNKVIAWCCDKAVSIFDELNHQYGLKLALPKAIHVEEFSKLNVDNPKLLGFCNWFPSKVIKSSDKVFPERTVFFNSKYDWTKINTLSSEEGNNGYWSSNHFMSVFLHEFAHCSHNNKMLKKLGYSKLNEWVIKVVNPEYVAEYKKNYSEVIDNISQQASLNPLESLAEDLSGKISNVLKKNSKSLSSSKISFKGTNPFEFNSYKKFTPIQTILSLFDKKIRDNVKRQELLRKIWNGEKL